MTDDWNDNWLEIGRIVAPQGLDGSVRVYPSSDFPERFLEPGDRWLAQPGQTTPQRVKLVSGRYLEGKGLYVLQLADVTDRNQAEQLRNAILFVPQSDRLPVAADEFHVADLLGMEVRLQANGQTIGTIVDLYTAGNDLLAVELTPPIPLTTPMRQGSVEANASTKTDIQPKIEPVLIPFVREIVPVVNLEEGYVAINPPKGLLPPLDTAAITD